MDAALPGAGAHRPSSRSSVPSLWIRSAHERRPVDDLAVRGRAGRASSRTPATATRPAPRPSEALAELEGAPGGQALLFSSGSAATPRCCSRCSSRARRSPSPRAPTTAPACSWTSSPAGASGTSSSTRRGTARRRRPRLARGAVEPVPDDARPRGGRRTSGARVVVDSTAATPGPPPSARARRRLRRRHRRRSTSPATTTRSSARWCRRDADAHERLRQFRQRTGPICAPDIAWLLLRGLETLEVRVARQTESAARSPGGSLRTGGADGPLPGFGGLLSFDVKRRRGRRSRRATTVIVNPTASAERIEDGVASPLGGRSRPGRAPAPLGRAGGRRRALGRPRARARR